MAPVSHNVTIEVVAHVEVIEAIYHVICLCGEHVRFTFSTPASCSRCRAYYQIETVTIHGPCLAEAEKDGAR